MKQRKVWLIFLAADMVHDLMKSKPPAKGTAKILQIKKIDPISVPSYLTSVTVKGTSMSAATSAAETVQPKEKEVKEKLFLPFS